METKDKINEEVDLIAMLLALRDIRSRLFESDLPQSDSNVK